MRSPADMSPKVSIIIPVYKTEESFLRQCLDSVINQTLEDIEILCVNNVAPPLESAILEEYALKDSRIKLIHASENRGPGGGRNLGLDQARGKYVYFADADDWLDVTLCEKVYHRMEFANCDVLFFGWHTINANSTELKEVEWLINRSKLHEVCWCDGNSTSYLANIFCVVWNRFVRTSFVRENNIRFPEGSLPEDQFFHWAILVNEPHVLIFSEQLYYYRVHDKSEIHLRAEYAANSVKAFISIKEYLIKTNNYARYKRLFHQRKLEHARWAIRVTKQEYNELAKKLAIDSMDDDDIVYLHEADHTNPYINSLKYYFRYSLGEKYIYWKMFYSKINSYLLRPFIRPVESLIRKIKNKPPKTKPLEQISVSTEQIEMTTKQKEKEEGLIRIMQIPDPNHRRIALLEMHIQEMNDIVFQHEREIVELRQKVKHQEQSSHSRHLNVG